MNITQNYILLQIVEKILNNSSSLCDNEDLFFTDENLMFSFSHEQKKELEKIKKELQKKCGL